MVALMASPLNSNISVTGLSITSSQTALLTFPSDLTQSSGGVSVAVLVIATGAPSVPITPVSFSSETATIVKTPHTAAYTSSAVPVKTGQLTTNQVGGIAVAGIASTNIVFDLMLFIYCLQQERVSREQKRQSLCKIEEPPLRTNQDHNFLRPPPPPFKDDAETDDEGTTEKATSRMAQGPRERPMNSWRWSFWRQTPNLSDIEAPFALESIYNLSPQDGTSCRTTLELLLNKPTYSLLPQPLNPHWSATTVIEKDLNDVHKSNCNLRTQASQGCNAVVTSQSRQHPHLQSLLRSQQYHSAGTVALMYSTRRGRRFPREYSISMKQQLHGKQRGLQPAHQPYTVWISAKSCYSAACMPGRPSPPNFPPHIFQLTAARSSNYLSNESLARSEQQLIQSSCLASHGPRWSETSFESAGRNESSCAETLLLVAEASHKPPFWA